MGNLRFTEFLSPLGREVKKLPPSNHTHLENKRTRSPQQPAPILWRVSGCAEAADARCRTGASSGCDTHQRSPAGRPTRHGMSSTARRSMHRAISSFQRIKHRVSSLGMSKAWLTTFVMTHRRICYRAVLAAWRQNRGTSAEASYLIASLGAPKTHRRLLCAWRHNDANKNTNANATNQKRKHDGGIVKPLCRPCVNMQTANSHIVSS